MPVAKGKLMLRNAASVESWPSQLKRRRKCSFQDSHDTASVISINIRPEVRAWSRGPEPALIIVRVVVLLCSSEVAGLVLAGRGSAVQLPALATGVAKHSASKSQEGSSE